MSILKKKFTCPNCKKEQQIKIYQTITDELFSSVVDRSLFVYSCSRCKEEIILDYPVIYQGNGYRIGYNIDLEKKHEDVDRLCLTYDDFKEKIIIYNDGLNDLIIEFIKEFIFFQLEKKEALECIRYNGIIDDKLSFFIMGPSKTSVFSFDFYNDLSARAKIKKIKDNTIIDKDTYRKYFKLR